MKKYITMVAILAAVTLASFVVAPPSTGAERSKRERAGEHKSPKGRDDTKAQWTADPEKGWVRTGESHQLQKDTENSRRNKINRSGNGSKKGS
jgi:hypothetical protein